MADATIATILLAAARRDAQAFRALVAAPDMNETVIGFHAHQSVEKALKAVLAHSGVAFRRTHDIAELLDTLGDAGRALPPGADRLDELNPFAVEARYGLVEPSGLDRAFAEAAVKDTLAWAETELARPAHPSTGPSSEGGGAQDG
jgi:HEPN domain-containing protein